MNAQMKFDDCNSYGWRTHITLWPPLLHARNVVVSYHDTSLAYLTLHTKCYILIAIQVSSLVS